MVAGKDCFFFFFFLNTICACGRGDASLMTESQSGVEAQQRLVATRPALANMFYQISHRWCFMVTDHKIVGTLYFKCFIFTSEKNCGQKSHCTLKAINYVAKCHIWNLCLSTDIPQSFPALCQEHSARTPRSTRWSLPIKNTEAVGGEGLREPASKRQRRNTFIKIEILSKNDPRTLRPSP